MPHLMPEERLVKLGLEIPAPQPPAANYVPWIVAGNLLIISGQLPRLNGEMKFSGTMSAKSGPSLEEAQKAAELCALHILAQVKEACSGDWDRVVGCRRLGGFVSSDASFEGHPKVLDGASDLILAALGREKGTHARAAIGCSALPLGALVEVEALFELKP